MPEVAPPGRAGRLWLRGRLEAARRGAELLDRKRELLAGELRGLEVDRSAARAEFLAALGEAERWGRRAELLGGTLEVELVAKRLEARASVELSFRNTMGVDHPDAAVVAPPPLPPLAAAASNGALGPAAAAYRRLIVAAAAHAVLEGAVRALEDELAATTRRARALERHRIPALERALDELELRLEELELEERVVSRWAKRRAERITSLSP